MTKNAILNIARQQIATLFVVCIGVGTTSNYLSSQNVIAQTISQTEKQPGVNIANVNEVKTFIYIRKIAYF